MRGLSENLQCKNPSFFINWLDPLDLSKRKKLSDLCYICPRGTREGMPLFFLEKGVFVKHTNIHCILYNVFSTMYTLSNSLQLTKSKLYGIRGIARRLTWAHYPDWPHHCLYNCPARCPWSWPWWWFWPKGFSYLWYCHCGWSQWIRLWWQLTQFLKRAANHKDHFLPLSPDVSLSTLETLVSARCLSVEFNLICLKLLNIPCEHF